MNLFAGLQQRASAGKPITVGLIGAGKFGSMYLSQVRKTAGVHLAAIADLNPARVKDNLVRVGWPVEQMQAADVHSAVAKGTTWVTDDTHAIISAPGIDIIIDATGNPEAGVHHVLLCCEHQKHIVMVNVEADALAGPYLANKAQQAGVVYSLAYGDQPALIAEMVDWARTAGFEVIAAGKGTKYLANYHQSTPATVWDHYGITAEAAALGGMNPQMFNSFLDGTKSAIEMAAVANACQLNAPERGLAFPSCGVDALADVLKPECDGGVLSGRGEVEVVSSLEPDGTAVYRDLRWGVYVTFAADSDYVRRCFSEYGLKTDDSGNYSSMYKPFHLIGLELGVSVASIGIRREPTGAPVAWNADAVCRAKRSLVPGEVLDGEGGYCVYSQLLPANVSVQRNALPIGLADQVAVTKPVAAGDIVTWDDVAIDESKLAVRIRRDMMANVQ